MSNLYLVAYYIVRPKNKKVRTQLEGWMKKPDSVSYDEQVAITRRLNNNDLSMAKIILDMKNKKVVKNGWLNNTSFDDLFLYFYKNYPQYTKEIMERLDPNYLLGLTAMREPERVIDTSGSLSSV
jgi:hypothetical protein